MEQEHWAILAIAIIMTFFLWLAVIVPTRDPFAFPKANISTPIPILTTTPSLTPQQTPTPRINATATPPSTPTPEPSATPEPSPSPSPSPAWMVKGYVCEVPDRLFGEPWVEEFKFQCACVIRGKYDLGVSFNVWNDCYSSTSTGWRRESCDCVEIICKARRELC